MRRNTSPAAAPTPTNPAPSHTMASGMSGRGPVEETARPGPAGAAAACGTRVGWDWRALMDSAVGSDVGRVGEGATAPTLAAGPAASPPASQPVAVPAAPPGAATASCEPDAWPAASVPGEGGVGAGAPPAGEVPAAGATPGAVAEVGPGWVPDPCRVAVEDAPPAGAAVEVVGPPVTKGVPETVGSGTSGSGSPVIEACAVACAVAVVEPGASEAFTAGSNAPRTAGMAGTLPRGVAVEPSAAVPARDACAGESWGGGTASSAKDACTPVERTSTAPNAAAAVPRRSPPWIPVRDMESSDLC